MKKRRFCFLKEFSNFYLSEDAAQMDPSMMQSQQPPMDPTQDPNAAGGQQQSEFQPLIKSAADIPLSKAGVERLKIAAQIRQIEAKTKEIEAKTQQAQMAGQGGQDPMGGQIDPATGQPMPGGGGQIDPNTGMPMDPMAQQGAVDPMTGQPMDPNAQQNNDPLKGLGDRSAPPDAMGGMGGGGIDPMTGQPMPGGDNGAEPFTALGRAFKLKEIFTTIHTLNKILKKQSDEDLLVLSTQLDKAFDLFKLIVNNLKSYKDQIDNIIIMYYTLLKSVSDEMTKILREKKLENSVN